MVRTHVWGTLALVSLCCHLGRTESKAGAASGAQRPRNVSSQISALAFAPDGTSVVAGRQDGKIQFHQVPQGNPTFTLANPADGVLSLAFAKDGTILAVGHGGGEISLWNVPKRILLRRWKAHGEGVGALLWNPQDGTLISGGYDSSIRSWQMPEAMEKQIWKIPAGRITSLAITADGKKLVSGGVADEQFEVNTTLIGTSQSDWVRTWETTTGKSEKMSLRGMNVAVSPDGAMVAAAGLMLDVRTNPRGTSFNGIDRLVIHNVAQDQLSIDTPWRGHLLATSGDGKYLATGGQNTDAFHGGIMGPNALSWRRMDVRLRVWDFAAAKELVRVPQEDARFIALAPDGKFLAAADFQGKLTIWDLDKEKRNPTPDPKEIIAIPADPWLAALVKDFERLAEKAPLKDRLYRAQLLLHQRNVTDALAILRQDRAPAAIPLVLRYLIETQINKNYYQWDAPALRDALVVLTGQTISAKNGLRLDAEAWYQSLAKTQAGLSTDLKQFSPEQLRTVLAVLAAKTMERHDPERTFSPTRLRWQIHGLLAGQDEGYQTWWPHELHPDMAPLMLEPMGHGDAARENQPIAWQYLPLLIELCRQGQAERVARLAQDAQENSAVRILCLWAHAAATGKLGATTAVDLVRQEKKLERRVAVILALEMGARNDVKAPLLECLKDPNRHVREAAILALTPVKAPEAVALIRPRLLDAAGPSTEATRAILECLAAVRTKEAQATLADYLRRTLAEPDRRQDLWYAVVAFGRAAGQQFQDPNAHFADEAIRRAAERALQWWAAKNPL
jgi:WD40 repeat protein